MLANISNHNNTFIRFIIHFSQPFLGKRNQYNKSRFKKLYIINFLTWLVLFPIKLVEILGFSIALNYVFKSLTKTRPLTPYETQELRLVFKNTINFSTIRVNENSKWAKIGAKFNKVQHLGFVWLKTINFTRQIDCKNNLNDMAWLTHEMVHVAQYQKLGLQYVFEALIAQHIGGYNYQNNLVNNANLNYYNLEQQAEIIKHYYINTKLNKPTSNFNKSCADLLVGQF